MEEKNDEDASVLITPDFEKFYDSETDNGTSSDEDDREVLLVNNVDNDGDHDDDNGRDNVDDGDIVVEPQAPAPKPRRTRSRSKKTLKKEEYDKVVAEKTEKFKDAIEAWNAPGHSGHTSINRLAQSYGLPRSTLGRLLSTGKQYQGAGRRSEVSF